VQHIYRQIQECLDERGKRYKSLDEEDLKRLAVDGSGPDVAKACYPRSLRPAEADPIV